MPFVVSAVTAVAGAISGVLAAGGIGAALVRLGGTLLLSYASQALMPKPPLQKRSVTLREPVSPRDLVYGRARKGGVIVFLHASGKKDRYLHLVVVLAAHRVKALGAIYFDGEEAVTAAGEVQQRWAGKLLCEAHLGSEDAAPFPTLRAELPELWTEAHRLAGCAALYLRLRYNADAFPGGIPNIAVDVEGKDDILDPRSGSRGYSENAALCLADYMAHPRFGIGAGIGAADGIEASALIEAANICDEAVPLGSGGVEPRYSCNGVVSLAEAPKTIIEGLLSAFAGRCAFSGGVWRIHAGAYRLPLVTLTSDDIREGGLTLATRISRSENFNAVRGQFVSPANDWQPDDFPAWRSALYRNEDGGEEVWRDLTLPFTLSATMAQRLARIELERARRQMTLRLAGKLSAWKVMVGETVLLSYARWGFAAKPFEVIGVSLDLSATGTGVQLLPEIVLRETSPLVYDWDAAEAAVYAAAPRTSLPSAFGIEPPGSPEITEALYVTRDGAGVKALARISWQVSPSPYVADYLVQAQYLGAAAGGAEGGDPDSDPDWADVGRSEGSSLEIRDIAPGTWTVRVKARSVLGIASIWRATTQEILGLSTPPAALSGLTLQSAGGLAVLKWDRVTNIDVRIGGAIVIRHSSATPPSWAASTSMDRVGGAEAIAVVPLKPGAYLLRAEDSGGRLGPVGSVSTAAVQALAFAPLDLLQADPAFEGSHQNTVAAGGVLTLGAARPFDDWVDLDAIPDLDWEGGVAPEGLFTALSGLDFGAPRRLRLRSEIALTSLGVFDRLDARSNGIDAWPDFDGATAGTVDVVVEIRHSDDDPGASPLWSDWARIDASEIAARAVQARAVLRSADPGWTPRVTQLRLHADEVA